MRYLSNTVSLRFDAGGCTGCGSCLEVCPHNVFARQGQRVALAARDNCMECGACALNCPTGAIQVKAGVGCAYAIIRGILTGSEPSCDCSPPAGPTASPCC
ncbi:MAG: mercury methylation ferredoxin HgcB [Thermodesulfobacteriota bacterium]